MASQPQATTDSVNGEKNKSPKKEEVQGKEKKDAAADEADGEQLKFSPEEEAVCGVIAISTFNLSRTLFKCNFRVSFPWDIYPFLKFNPFSYHHFIGSIQKLHLISTHSHTFLGPPRGIKHCQSRGQRLFFFKTVPGRPRQVRRRHFLMSQVSTVPSRCHPEQHCRMSSKGRAVDGRHQVCDRSSRWAREARA